MSQSPKSKKGTRSAADMLFDSLGALLPSCGPAMHLVELGQQRPLKLREKFVLLYNSPLCLHCNCNRRKFEEEKAKMQAFQSSR